MLLSLKMGFSFVRAVVACAIFERTSGLEFTIKLKHPSNFIAGRLKAAFLFWFFGDIRCGALLFVVTLVIYK